MERPKLPIFPPSFEGQNREPKNLKNPRSRKFPVLPIFAFVCATVTETKTVEIEIAPGNPGAHFRRPLFWLAERLRRERLYGLSERGALALFEFWRAGCIGTVNAGLWIASRLGAKQGYQTFAGRLQSLEAAPLSRRG